MYKSQFIQIIDVESSRYDSYIVVDFQEKETLVVNKNNEGGDLILRKLLSELMTWGIADFIDNFDDRDIGHEFHAMISRRVDEIF